MSIYRPVVPRSSSEIRLPPVATSFVGRVAEVSHGRDLLTGSDVRLLTLTGPGGVGKTRLALVIAGQAREVFPDGVGFVPLAPIRDPALVLPTIAQRLNVPDRASVAPWDSLTLSLRERRMLLVLDNFEQIVAAAPEISRLLDACPSLRLMITSRVPLRIAGETEFPIAPFHIPSSWPGSIDEIVQLAAVDLFVQRARAVNPALVVDGNASIDIAEVCRWVDGLPLAIELAAARCRSVNPAELRASLMHRVPLPDDGGTGDKALRLTLRDTIDWSYGLLLPDEQRLFRWLAIFNGGFAQESAAALCYDLGVDPSATTGALIDQGLVRRVARPGQPERWRLLETVREFALALLDAADEQDKARDWHASCFTTLAADAAAHLVGSEQIEWLDLLDREHDNLRMTLRWALASRDVDRCLAIGAGLWRFWERRGHVSEARLLLEQIIDLADGVPPTLAYAGALFGFGRMRYLLGDFDLARTSFLELVGIAQALDNVTWLSGAYTQLAHLATRNGDYQEARRLGELGLVLRRQAGDTWGTAVSLLVLGRNAHYLGDDDRATRLTEEGIELFRQAGDRQGMSDGYDELGEYTLSRGKFALARGHIEQALTYHQELGDDAAVATSLALLGHVAIGQRNYVGALSLYMRSLNRLIDLGARWRIDPALEGLAEVALATGKAERAVRIMAAAERIQAERHSSLDPDTAERWQRNLNAARVELGITEFNRAWQAGRTLSFEAMTAEALAIGQPDSPPA